MFRARSKRNTTGAENRYLAKLLFEAPNRPPSSESSGMSNVNAN